MNEIDQNINPSKEKFETDPFGYSAFGRMRLGILTDNLYDIEQPATSAELKNPVLWLTHAEALSQAAIIIMKSDPEFENLPSKMQGICDGQFRATGLMLVGYSLEICLKAMLIMKKGVEIYNKEEKKYLHHELHKLANFVPALSEKDKAILELLTHYVYWAGRYPDPGYGKEHKTERIFTIANKHKITAKDLFQLASKVMTHARVVANGL